MTCPAWTYAVTASRMEDMHDSRHVYSRLPNRGVRKHLLVHVTTMGNTQVATKGRVHLFQMQGGRLKGVYKGMGEYAAHPSTIVG